MKKAGRYICLVMLVVFAAAASGGAAICLKKFTFDEDGALKSWSRMVLNGQVDYRQMRSGEAHYVDALSDRACSALYYRIGFKLKDYPYLAWKWRVLKFPDISKAKTDMDRDDYAARVYVIFPFLSFSSSKFLEYVWSEDIPEGTVMDSPAGSNVKIIVARSGHPDKVGWFEERRNVYDDYIKVFKEKPKRSVGAVAIMCDADGTRSVAESAFDDIAISNL